MSGNGTFTSDRPRDLVGHPCVYPPQNRTGKYHDESADYELGWRAVIRDSHNDPAFTRAYVVYLAMKFARTLARVVRAAQLGEDVIRIADDATPKRRAIILPIRDRPR